MRSAVWCAALVLCAVPAAAQSGDAIRLYVNTIEIETTTPPILVGERVYLPVRDTYQALGAKLDWDDAEKALTISVPDHELVFPTGKKLMRVDGDELDMGELPRVVNGAMYLSESIVVRSLPIDFRFVRDERTVEVSYRWEEAPVEVGKLIEWPGFYRGKPLILEGKYLGWLAKGLEGPVREGPPVHRGDWILQDDTGAIYITGERPKSLDPLDDAGKRVRVTGVGRLLVEKDARRAYVEARDVEPVRG